MDETEVGGERLLDGRLPRQHVGDAMLGAVDGIITTFAIIAGATGGRFSGTVIVVLAFASLLADGLSMGVSNYLGSKSDRQLRETQREEELARIKQQPEAERERLRREYREKGLEGRLLDEVVETLTGERERWAREIVRVEEGKAEETSIAWSGVATALAFIVAGAVPILPFLFVNGVGQRPAAGAGGWAGLLDAEPVFYISAAVAAVTFFGVGAIKGRVVGQSWWRAGLETLAAGGTTAVVAYLVGYFLRQAIGASGVL
ncbi:MAG: VIT1/CCC1 transporter family protein [Candidatus Promineifilaceae bacterium]|nr:VIT1/CCC1 transporter family protein [Candidatus Promineifilaceae bacterium]